jgi:predicted DNA binding CopG/RHH family protein
MPVRKPPPAFKNETEEAEWWAAQQDYVAAQFEQAQAAGTLRHGTAARLARERAGASPTITIRLPQTDIDRAKALAAERGLRYQTFLKMLLHQALDAEERRERVG